MVSRDHLQGTMAGIHDDPERDYSQKAYGKNALVVCELRQVKERIVKILRQHQFKAMMCEG